jgi:molybdate transport system regulatory protein
MPNRQTSFGDAAIFVQNAQISGNFFPACLFFWQGLFRCFLLHNRFRQGYIPGMAIAGEKWVKIKVQLMHGEEIAMGPGKAALLDAIAQTGSISAAGRMLGMSYRRTWMLVDVMNRCWKQKLVETQAGGGAGRGARLTDDGQRVLRAYRVMEAAIDESTRSPALAELESLRAQM